MVGLPQGDKVVTLLDKIPNSSHGIPERSSPHWGPICSASPRRRRAGLGNKIGESMRRSVLPLKSTLLRHLAVPALVIALGCGSALAQSGDNHAQDQQGKGNAATPHATKENERKTAEFAEAAQVLNGPAGNPECVWLGRRVVRLMWVDDLDTAFRHLDLYDRFGCPGGHIQAAFRCLTRFGAQIDPKVSETLNGRVHACWINPNAQPQAAASPPPPTGAPAPAPAPAEPP